MQILKKMTKADMNRVTEFQHVGMEALKEELDRIDTHEDKIFHLMQYYPSLCLFVLSKRGSEEQRQIENY